MYMDVPHNDMVYMYTLLHSVTLHSITVCVGGWVGVGVYACVYLMNY